MADGLEHDRAAAVGEVPDPVDPVGPALGHHVGGSERPAEVGPRLVAAHQHDAVGAELPGREHGEEADGPVADHGDGAARGDATTSGCVPAGAVDVGEGQQRGEQALVAGLGDAGDGDQGAVGERDAHGLGLRAAGPEGLVVPEPAVDARGLEARATELTDSTRDREGCDHEVARRDGGDVGTDLLDHADQLVPDRAAVCGDRRGVVRVQVAAAHAGAGHAHQRVGGLLELRSGAVITRTSPAPYR